MFEEDSYLTEDDANKLLPENANDFGSFQYMPREFLGMSTSELGFHIVGKESPFLTLKNKILEDGPTMKLEDRTQAIRYLCSIPYNNATYHCVEAALSLITDASVDIYKRFYFFSNSDKYFRLDDHVVNYLHPAFFKYGLKYGPIQVPFELMIMSAKYIFNHYGPETQPRQTVLDWCLDICENENEDISTKLKVLTFLRENGESDERRFVDGQLQELGVSNCKVEATPVEAQASDFLRALRKKHATAFNSSSNPEKLFVACVQHAKNKLNEDDDFLDYLSNFFSDVINSPTSFETILIGDIAWLISKEIESLRSSDPFIAEACIDRFVAVVKNGFDDPMQLIHSMLTIFEGFVTPVPLQLSASNLERLRNEIFAALTEAINNLNEGLRRDVEESRRSEDKAAAREFLIFFEDEKELIKQKCKDITPQEFEDTYLKVIEEWIQ